MILNDLFKQFQKINKTLDNQLLEISVKQHQLVFLFKDKSINLSLLKNYDIDNSFVSLFQDNLFLTIENMDFEQMDKSHVFYSFFFVITQFSEKICQCPSLEFVVSEQYIKCFLDKAGLTISDLNSYEEVLEASGKGELELHPQRPYLLFINENQEV